jgi:Aldehyde dehydrogenase family
MPDRRAPREGSRGQAKPRASQGGAKAPATESQGPQASGGPGVAPRDNSAKAPATESQGPQASGGPGVAPRDNSAKAPATESQGPQASGGPGVAPRDNSAKAPATESQGPQASGGSGGSLPRASSGARVRPRAGQPAKLAGAAPVPGAEDAVGRETRSRLDVRKTYKLYIGGAFPRSESGRSYPVTGPDGTLLAHAARASRKDARDAVVAARKAGPGWAGATAYNRGQVLYRVAELLEGREAQFAGEIVKNEGLSAREAARTVAEAIDRWVWYAGWPDKVAQVAGSANPVAGPYFNFSVPEPTGVVAVLAPGDSGLLGLVSVLAPVIATGNTAVLVASEAAPLAAITLAEVLATSDVPGGVVNILTGRLAELAPVLAAHMDVNAIDLTGAPAGSRAELERLAAGNVKRVFTAEEDWAAAPSPARMLAFLEIKTVWHPVGV